MRIIVPTPVTTAMLTSSTVPENDYAEWAAGTTYAVGNRVIVAAAHKVYESLTSGNIGKAPATNPTDWLDLGATNRWRMFDEKIGTITTAANSVSFTLAPGIITGVALMGLSAQSVQVTMTDPIEGVVYDRTISLYNPVDITSWWRWFFGEIRRKASVVLDDLPSYRNASTTITLTDTGATVACGVCVVGKVAQFSAAVDYGASVGIQDYSIKSKDQWGNYSVTERAFNKRARFDFLLNSNDVDWLHGLLADLRARPAVYAGSGVYESTVLYGFYKDFDIVIAYPTHSQCSLEIEGLT